MALTCLNCLSVKALPYCRHCHARGAVQPGGRRHRSQRVADPACRPRDPALLTCPQHRTDGLSTVTPGMQLTPGMGCSLADAFIVASGVQSLAAVLDKPQLGPGDLHLALACLDGLTLAAVTEGCEAVLGWRLPPPAEAGDPPLENGNSFKVREARVQVPVWSCRGRHPSLHPPAETQPPKHC